MTDETMEAIANRVRNSWLAERHDTPSPPTVPTLAPQNAESRAIQIALNSPMEWDLTRNQRGRLRRLKQQVLNPDLTGYNSPEESDYREFPQLRDLQQQVETARKARAR